MSTDSNDSKYLSKVYDVRVVYLPPSTVAAYQYVGDQPEMHANQMMNKFVREHNLVEIKPDLRHYGFNSPSPAEGVDTYGYEVMVTIPDDIDVPNPIVKKHFEGGLYAAHMIPLGAFDEYHVLNKWLENSETYVSNSGERGPECMFGALEEHLNYLNHVNLPDTQPKEIQLDLLIPIKLKG